MNWYHSSLRNKLLVMIGALLLVLSTVTLWAFWSFWKTTMAFDYLNRTSVSQERAILVMSVDFKEQVQEWKNILLRGKDPAALEKYWNAFVSKESSIRENGKQLLVQIKNEESRKLVTEFVSAHEKMGESYRKGLQAFKDAGMESKAGDAAVKGIDRTPTEFLDQAVKAIGKEANQNLVLTSGQARTDVVNSVALFGALMVLVLFSLIQFIGRNVARPAREALRVAEGLASGDLSLKSEARGRDEMGQLLTALQGTADQLSGIVSEVKQSTATIDVASKEIARGNADLSQRTEEQASSLEETASSVEELTSTVKQNAENAKQANQLALGASAVAVQGGTVVGQVVETMSSINESSKKIVDIIGVIDGIAFQTNILALNAAVEAARAGEQGRGFAVVASEVRNLAQRSAAAAKEIKALIGDSVDKVGAGTKLVDEAGKTMQEIVTSVKRVTDIMSEITAASQEQSSGIEQVNQAIAQMDEATQQNAALVEEAAAAAEAMQEQAQHLTQAVSVFKLAAEGGANPLAAVPAAPVERRSASRAKNVARLPVKGKSKPGPGLAVRAKTGTDDGDWAEF